MRLTLLPWAISMSLPYGTMTDDEMKAMPLAQLQKDGGLLFLWVTGRAVGGLLGIRLKHCYPCKEAGLTGPVLPSPTD